MRADNQAKEPLTNDYIELPPGSRSWTDEQVMAYTRAIYAAARALGIKNMSGSFKHKEIVDAQ